MKKYSAVIFDLDGTLLNTLDDLADSLNGSLSRYGFPMRTTAEVRSFVGNGVARLIELAIPDGRQNPDFENCLEDYRVRYSKNMRNKTGPYPGIPELLERLSKEAYRMAVVSNKFDSAVKALSREFFGDHFIAAIGESPDVAKKPAPDAVFKALREIGCGPEQALYVGDSEVDVLTARNAGIQCAGVTWGFRDREVLIGQGADYIIDTPDGLLRILEEQ